MATFYDARGNIYAVASPDELRGLGLAVPADAAQAALQRRDWSVAAVEALCGWAGQEPGRAGKHHRSDGLLVGPFQCAAPFDLLIVNTDGTLAERSGNGLTIFSQALSEQGLLPAEGSSLLRVHHDQPGGLSPVATAVEPAQVEGQPGFWLALGRPEFGPAAVGARGAGQAGLNGRQLSRVASLAELNDAWQRSQFVRVGNPHCVTLVEDVSALPSNAQMLEATLEPGLTAIAFAPPLGSGEPCPAGVNLQWATLEAPGQLQARVFERGEGPTASSGTSASAVACAAWRVGWVAAGEVRVSMPGGTAPIRLLEQAGELQSVQLFGAARRQV
ncbi:diaminopimelate epimerase [Pseudomonas vanderleydeniana]|uniref:Diaminopimelate epimerase n=1 Tax=Pseudomonas vanderleydeniana TaxID=2745495 RepID=A0A9E6PPL1_9PSED|nr:diaminopimelate epimerase [Pseudomonas vanderleydeniana]QXI30380.1 diaminopimelate epimerase [Pseudomonas vanderleydeniana]